MTYTCPDGHTSTSADYCDVCGAPIGSAGAAAPAPAPPASGPAASGLDLDAPPPAPAPSRSCPNCSADNVTDALFCEVCGYDFTTGQMPQPLAPPPGMAATAPPVDISFGADPAPPGPVAPPPGPVPAAAAPDAAAGAAPGAAPDADPDAAAGDGGDRDAALQPPPTDPAPPSLPPAAQTPAELEWVAEVWIDPDWHGAQDMDDPCPSPGMPVVVPLRSRSLLVGRTSSSRNIHPDIDVATDTGVSRRHAQLTTDGQRWWVEDLQSANGTYVGAAGEPLPTDPIAPTTRVEVPDDGRIYVGAWTRIVLRRASAAEKASAGTF